jgi:hypothetical protein
VERIQKDVKEKIALLGKEGGYFCSADQWMPFPEAHQAALKEAVEVYGRY